MESELERIKGLAASAVNGPWQMDPETFTVLDPDGDGLAYDLRDEETAQLMAQARTLVPQLVALIEKIDADAKDRAARYRDAADRLWHLVNTRHPDRNIDDAQRYEAYANVTRATAIIIEKTIKEGLTS